MAGISVTPPFSLRPTDNCSVAYRRGGLQGFEHPKRALQYYCSAGIIPYTALGNEVLFQDDDIRQLLEKNLIKGL